MKYLTVAAALLLGMGSAGYCQASIRAQPGNQQVHPGTALLDSMGIVAGVPDGTELAEARSAATGTEPTTADATQKRP
ncbi:MAG TPA: hypothetical protein VHT74_18830 [Acetobacteraceae bacterium]|jgi:hypothetical protein|nr:hypothetical protein [Acetobacteraceae bacterium]